jgi:ribosomal protein S18 acetylase RimI-like enzyme
MIREARASELSRLQAIEREAGERFRDTAMAFVLDAPPTPADAYADALRAGLLLVVEAAGAPVGFLAAREMPGALHILEVSVHPDFGRRGHAGALLRHAAGLAQARNLPLLTLTTDRLLPWNAPLWARYGFIEAGDACPDWLRAILDTERDAGFDPARRVAMLRPA